MPMFETAGYLAGELCPQRLHVKQLGLLKKQRKKSKK
jgi:hypothetical protein